MNEIIQFPFSLSKPDPRLRKVRNFDAELSGLASMHAWFTFRPEDITLDSAGRIASVRDRSGKGRLLKQDAASLRPSWDPYAANGQSVARFLNHGFVFDGPFPAAQYSIVLAVRVPATTTRTSMTPVGNQGNPNRRIYLEPITNGGRAFHQVQNGASANPGVTPTGVGQLMLVVASFHGPSGKVKIRVNQSGVANADNGPAQIAETPFYVGYGGQPSGVPSSPLEGDIALVQISNVALLESANESELRKYEDYVRNSFGLLA